MSTPDLLVDLEMVEETRVNLASILKEFTQAEKFSDQVANATGHTHLANTVHDFATSWNIHRESMIEAIQALHDMVQKAHDDLVDVDNALADAISSTSTEAIGAHGAV